MSCCTTFNFTDEHIPILLIPLSKSPVNSIWTKHGGVCVTSSKVNATAALDAPAGQEQPGKACLFSDGGLMCGIHCAGQKSQLWIAHVTPHLFLTPRPTSLIVTAMFI